MLAADNPVIDLLDFLGREPSADGFDDILVVTLAVETAVNGVIVDTRLESGIIVVDYRKILGVVVFEDYNPVMGEDLAVIGNKFYGSSPLSTVL